MQKKFDIVLIEKPGTEGLTNYDVIYMYNRLKEETAYPIEIGDINGNSSAMGFITPSAAEKLGYEYTQDSYIGKFVANILDDMNNESENGTYTYEGLNILITRR